MQSAYSRGLSRLNATEFIYMEPFVMNLFVKLTIWGQLHEFTYFTIVWNFYRHD